MLIKGLKTVSKERGINRIVAYVKTDNLASIKLFSKAGFKKMDELIIEGVRAYKMLYDKENIL
ncbi:MAG TPA: hypothetical protein DDW17_05770 [Deltaproteobacteria bacterium]|nr:hypothetical protein [Deltaproteobacteria bacterium]